MSNEEESHERGNGFDHRWNGLDYNMIEISHDNGESWEPMVDEKSIAEHFDDYTGDEMVEGTPYPIIEKDDDWTPTNETVDTAFSGTAIDLNHPMAQGFQNLDCDYIAPEMEPYKVIECKTGLTGISPGGVSWTKPQTEETPKMKWRKRFGETIKRKGRK